MFWLCIVCMVLSFIIIALLIKLVFIYKAMKEIRSELHAKLETDTNTLITISSSNRHIRRLAADLNVELRLLRKERRRFQSGDVELKDAVTNISHDLRTPLTAICGYLDLLKREEKSEAVKRYLDMIENRSEVLKRLTEELFCYSIVSSTAEDVVLEDVVLNSILEESISTYYAALKNSRITPEISMPRQKIVRKLNHGSLTRIFGNIISNAIKYSDGDLNIMLTKDGELIFSNHAAKLDGVQTAKLFHRFYTIEDAKNSTGLGLSIAKTLTEQLNGNITADYQDGMLSIRIVFPEL